MKKLLAAVAGIVLLGGCATHGGPRTWWSPVDPAQGVCDSGNANNKVLLCYIAVDPDANPQVKKRVNLYRRGISVVWVAPEGYEFWKQDVKLKDPKDGDQFVDKCPGRDDNENNCEDRGRYYRWHDHNSRAGEIEYVIQLRKGTTIIPIDPTLVNQG